MKVGVKMVDINNLSTVLNDLQKLEDVYACMLAKRGLEGLIPHGSKISDINLWSLIKETTDSIFDIIDKFYDYNIDRIYLELGQYNIIVATLSRSLSLIVVVPTLVNRGLIDIEIENTKRKILEIMR